MNKLFSLRRIVALFLAIGMLFLMSSCKKEDARMHEYEVKLAELNAQKRACENEIYLLTNGMREAIGHNSYMSFIFLGVDKGLYDDIFPILESGSIKLSGVLCVSEGELPGGDGNITIDQYVELMDHGWETALYWRGAFEGSELGAALEFEEFLSAMKSAFSGIAIDFPVTVVFDQGAYLPEYDVILERYGIENAVHDGLDEIELISSEKPEGIWHTAAIGWRDLERSVRLRNKIVLNGGYASFKIGFDTGEDDFDTAFYAIKGETADLENNMSSVRTSKFKSMVSKFKSSIRDGDVCVSGVSEARADMEIYYPNRDYYLANSDARVAELRLMIADIERKKSNLYNEYFRENGGV